MCGEEMLDFGEEGEWYTVFVLDVGHAEEADSVFYDVMKLIC